MDFYDLDAWKKSHELTLIIYKSTLSFPKTETFGITDQLRRASSSISANIAEGYGRHGYADKIKFLYQARGSIKEVQSFIILARDLQYCDQQIKEKVFDLCDETEKLINGLIKYFFTKNSAS